MKNIENMKKLLMELEEINKGLPNMDESLDRQIKEYRIKLINKISTDENKISKNNEEE